MRRRMWLVGAVLGLAVASPAHAAFPGDNGPLVLSGLDAASGTVQIYRTEPAGGIATRVTAINGQVWNECPTWSSDGRLVYFDSFDRGVAGPSHIYRMTATGGSRTLVDGQNAPARVCPSVSKDGKQIAAIEYANDGSQGVVLMDADGSDAKIIATAGANQNIYAPRFSPFGSRIVFNEVTYNGDQIVNADVLLISAGGGITNITRRFDDQFFSPSWAPTGSAIVAVRGSAADEIVRVSVLGTTVRSLIKVPGAALSSPTFSPDGSKIAFLQCVGDCGDPQLAGTGSLWVMDADGSDLTLVLDQTTAGMQPFGYVDWGVSP